uniref:NAD kinase 1 n=1 Tax=Arundo donax TaxID=35708 RepID=A0A0A9EHR4_ARUDO
MEIFSGIIGSLSLYCLIVVCILLYHVFNMTYNLQMEAVAKMLRRVVEGKAASQAEAAEWKRKYELEKEVKEHKHHNVVKGII